jgi:hypothetical protein
MLKSSSMLALYVVVNFEVIGLAPDWPKVRHAGKNMKK